MTKNKIEILQKNNLQKTECRLDILQFFLQNDIALSEEKLMQLNENKYNKTTIYRTLNTFTEKGIIHKIITNNNVAKYSLSVENLSSKHLHFECKNCKSVYCLKNSEISNLNLPDGFSEMEFNFLVFGVCKNCNN